MKRHFRFESLEKREVLSTMLYIDYGDSFPNNGVLQTTVGALDRTVFDPNPQVQGDENPDIDGPRLYDANGTNYADATPVTIQSLASVYGANAPALRATMNSLVRRFYEALDVTIVDLTAQDQYVNGRAVQAAANLSDVSRTLGLNEAEFENNDAYVFVGLFTIGADPDPADGVQTGGNPQFFDNNPATAGNQGSYGGLSTTTDMGGNDPVTGLPWFGWNNNDGTAFVFLNGPGPGGALESAVFQGNQIAHESAHVLGMRHVFGDNPANQLPPAGTGIDGVLPQSDLMSYLAYGNPGNFGFNFFSRYPMVLGEGNMNNNVLSAPTTPFDKLRFDGNIGPSHIEYVTGTGQNDIITVTRYNDYLANVSVQAFSDAAYTRPLAVPGTNGTSTTYSFLIPLDRPLLVEGGANNDRIVLDADLRVQVTVRGMQGVDTLVIQGKNAASVLYTPGTNTAAGLDGNSDLRGIIQIDSMTINFQEFEPGSQVLIQDAAQLTLRTPLDRDQLTVRSPAAGQTQVTGTSGGVAMVPLLATRVGNLVLDTGANDRGSNNDDIFIEGTPAGTTVLATTGAGDDTVLVGANLMNLDNLRGEVTMYGGAGNNRLVVFDWNNPHLPSGGAATTYSIESFQLTRRPPTGAAAVIHYAEVGNVQLWTGDHGNLVNVTGAPELTEVFSGAAGDSLTLDDRGTGNVADDSLFIVNKPTFAISDGAITRSNREYYFQIDDVGDVDPRLPEPPRIVQTVTDSRYQINYSNIRELVVHSGPVGATFNINSTATNVPVTINAATPVDSVQYWRTPSGGFTTIGQAYNAFHVGADGTLADIRSPLTLNGSGPDNRLGVNNSNATTRDIVTVTPTAVGAAAGDQFFGANGRLVYTAMSALTLNLSSGFDNLVRLTPSAATTMTVNGNAAAFQSNHAALLNLDASGTANPVNTATSPGAGQWTFDNRQPVNYTNLVMQSSVDPETPPPTEGVITKLYRQVLGRDPEPAGLSYWVERINAGATYGTVASGIFESAERLDPIIRQYYRDYLLREAEPAGVEFYREMWRRDGGPDNVVANIISSAEFYASAGGTNTLWVTELYRRLLGREPDAPGLDYWTTRLDSGQLGRQQVVFGFTRSDENFRNLVTGWYRQYLNRLPTPEELDARVARMRSGASQRDIQIALIDSPEYAQTP